MLLKSACGSTFRIINFLPLNSLAQSYVKVTLTLSNFFFKNQVPVEKKQKDIKSKSLGKVERAVSSRSNIHKYLRTVQELIKKSIWFSRRVKLEARGRKHITNIWMIVSPQIQPPVRTKQKSLTWTWIAWCYVHRICHSMT